MWIMKFDKFDPDLNAMTLVLKFDLDWTDIITYPPAWMVITFHAFYW